ncbi:dipeptidase PepE [Paucihalobacter ruber]|uniref:Dipeptidase PepE n=1 Tax=Paucihalobacter ruber TaxID=2567861 RepID=A0A506PQ41_9FLAO|nr:dipeptidase PepE [Paucihalobacter ruber]TPV35688.1 dipeptidase PepE [Paucihalobacter ruber]
MKLILASTSTIYGGKSLSYLQAELTELYKNVTEVLFIPYARPGGISHQEYTNNLKPVFAEIGINLKGIHEFENPIEAIEKSSGIFTGGGNTFVLLYQLYKNELILPLQKAIKNGTPYLGTSAGSNICGLTINTTNDMPIVYPPSFKALSIVPFNLNPHYIDPEPNSKHMGETRETRIKEFHAYHTQPVIGLREGSWLEINSDDCMLKGSLSARVFESNKAPYEIDTNTNLNYLK